MAFLKPHGDMGTIATASPRPIWPYLTCAVTNVRGSEFRRIIGITQNVNNKESTDLKYYYKTIIQLMPIQYAAQALPHLLLTKHYSFPEKRLL